VFAIILFFIDLVCLLGAVAATEKRFNFVNFTTICINNP